MASTMERVNFLRRSPFRYGGRGGFKEWFHFLIQADGLAILCNFSLSDVLRGPDWLEIPRVTCLIHSDAGWEGDVKTYAPTEMRVRGGRLDLCFGQNRMAWRDERFHIHLDLPERGIAADLQLRPMCAPSLIPNVAMDTGNPLHWVIVPRLEVSGEVHVAGVKHTLVNAQAYHDHNWGHWQWGDDFAWEWGFGLPDDPSDPWHVVFVRLTNRARTHAMSQGLFLWHGSEPRRSFRELDVAFHHVGLYRQTHWLKTPRPMALLAPETVWDIPQELRVNGHWDDDNVELRFVSEEAAQILIPNDLNLETTVINEVAGRVTMMGRIGGANLHWEGRGVCEILGS